jgi:hypothetical protein
LFTRPVTFILSGMTAVATSYAHAPRDFFPILNAGEFGSALLRRLSLPCRSRRRPVERRPRTSGERLIVGREALRAVSVVAIGSEPLQLRRLAVAEEYATFLPGSAPRELIFQLLDLTLKRQDFRFGNSLGALVERRVLTHDCGR